MLITLKRWKRGLQNEATLTRLLKMKWMKKVNFGESSSKTKPATGVPFVVTYHPKPKALSKIIHGNLNLLYMNDEVKDTFTPRPMICFRTFTKRSSYLVRAKLFPLKRGSRKFSKKRCEVSENVQNSDIFRSSVTSEMFINNHRWTYDDKCLVYFFTVKHDQNGILEKPQINLDSEGMIINLMTESLREDILVCKNISMIIFIVMAIMVSMRMLQ